MDAVADVLGAPKPGKERYARTVLQPRASPLLLVNRLRTNTVRVAACYADRPPLGSAWVPVRPRQPDRLYERALCAWWNSTPGILTLLHRRAKALDSLRSLLVPDPGVVDTGPLAEAFARCRQQTLLPWPRMHECPVRSILDQAAARVLLLDARTLAKWRVLISHEPTVSGIRAKLPG